MAANEQYPIHVILGDSTYSKIRTDEIIMGCPADPTVEGMTFGWVIHGGIKYFRQKVYIIKETCNYEKLYS